MTTLKSTGMLRITVKDSGPGVQNELQSRMFEEEVSTKGDGRGLGLHLIREAVRQLRGTISYSFDEESAFCIQLPLGPD